jgi:hypothetical protein
MFINSYQRRCQEQGTRRLLWMRNAQQCICLLKTTSAWHSTCWNRRRPSPASPSPRTNPLPQCHDDANALIYVATSPPPGPYAVMVMAHGHRSSAPTNTQWSTSPSRSTPTHTPHLPCSCSAVLRRCLFNPCPASIPLQEEPHLPLQFELLFRPRDNDHHFHNPEYT